jgi:hypothetical protein
MLFREKIVVYRENHMEHMNTLCGQNQKFLLNQVVCIVTIVLYQVTLRNFWEDYQSQVSELLSSSFRSRKRYTNRLWQTKERGDI